MQGGAYAAKVIRRRVLGRPYEPFRYSDHGDVAVIGRLAGVTNIGWLGPFGRQGGFTAWALWLGIHIFYLIGFSNRIVVLIRWAWSFLTHGRGDAADHGQGLAAADRGARAAGPRADGARDAASGRRRAWRARPGLGATGAQSKTTTWRSPSPARSRSKAPSRSSRPIRRSIRRSTGQPAGEMERGVAREVDRRVGEPVVRAEDPPAAVDERVDRERRPRLERRHPDEDRGPAERQASIASSTVAGRPIASNTKSGPPSVRSRSASIVAARSSVGEQAVGRAERPRHVELGRDPVDRHDPRGAGQHGAHHARQPDAAEPDDRDARAGRHRGGLEHGPDPGRHAAADERRDRRIDAVGEGDGGRLGDDGRAGHRADPAVRQDRPRRRGRSGPWRRRASGGGTTGSPGRPTAGRRRTPGRRRTGRATTARPAGPTDSDRTPGPTASTTPAPSWPIAIGVGRGQSPSRTWRSEWQTPDARILTRTSPARGSARLELLDRRRLAGGPQHRGPGRGHVSAARRRSAGRAGTYGT